MYTDSKLLCIQQLSMDLFLVQLFLTLHYHPTLCPFPEAPPWCLWDSAMPCGEWLELSVSGMGQPQPFLTEVPQSLQPVPGHGHMAQWRKDSKEPEAAPAHLMTPPEISAAMRESSIVETGQCHLNCDEVLNMLVEHQILTLQPRLTVIIASPTKQDASILLFYLWVRCYTDLMGCYTLSTSGFSLSEECSTDKQLMTTPNICKKLFWWLMRWFNTTEWGHLIWLIKGWSYLLQTVPTEKMEDESLDKPMNEK